MADGMVKSQSFSTDILALVGDAKGASKAIKAEMRSAEKEVKAAERELKKLEKEKAKALKGGGAVGSVDRKMAEQRALMSKAQSGVATLESKKKQQDQLKEIMDATSAKAKNTIDKRFNMLRGDMMGIVSQIRSGRPSEAMIRSVGMGIGGAGKYLEGKGFAGIGGLLTGGGARLGMATSMITGAVATGSGIGLALKVATDVMIGQNKANEEASRQQMAVENKRMDIVRQQSFSSGMSAKRSKELLVQSQSAGERARKAFRGGNTYAMAMGAIGDIFGADFRGSEKSYVAQAGQKEHDMRKLTDKWGKGLSIGEAGMSSFVREQMRKETGEGGLWWQVGTRAAQAIQDKYGLGETSEQKRLRLSQDYRLKFLQDKEKTREDTIARLQEDPMFINIQAQYNNHLRAVEEQAYISVGNAHHM